jgi:hypothetical protein
MMSAVCLDCQGAPTTITVGVGGTMTSVNWWGVVDVFSGGPGAYIGGSANFQVSLAAATNAITTGNFSTAPSAGSLIWGYVMNFSGSLNISALESGLTEGQQASAGLPGWQMTAYNLSASAGAYALTATNNATDTFGSIGLAIGSGLMGAMVM